MDIECRKCHARFTLPDGASLADLAPCPECQCAEYFRTVEPVRIADRQPGARMTWIECRKCRARYVVPPGTDLAGVTACRNCQARDYREIEPAMRLCPDCAEEISAHARFCPHCGAWFRDQLGIELTRVKLPFGDIFTITAAVWIAGVLFFTLVGVIGFLFFRWILIQR